MRAATFKLHTQEAQTHGRQPTCATKSNKYPPTHSKNTQQCSVTLPTHKQQDARAPRLYVHAQGLHGQRCSAYDTDKRHASAPDPTSAAPTSVTAVRDSHEWCVHWSMCVCAHHVGMYVCTVRLQWPRGKLQLCHMCSAPHKRSMRLNGSLLFRVLAGQLQTCLHRMNKLNATMQNKQNKPTAAALEPQAAYLVRAARCAGLHMQAMASEADSSLQQRTVRA